MLEIFERKRLIPFLMKLSDDIFHAPRWRRLEQALLESSAGRGDYFFVQIGANDGVTHDRLNAFILDGDWAGILVEPVPYYFQKLQRTYAGRPKLLLENVAIATAESTRDIYRVREGVTHLPAWVNGIASLDRQVLLNHKWAIPNIEDYIVTDQIHCVTLASVLRRHKVAHIDLLAIDTEGHDYEVIKQVDFHACKPRVITYEHKHLSKADRKDCEALLRRHDYTVSKQLGNTLAYVATTTPAPGLTTST
jgi:FkbM family methyltransferase